VDRDRQRDDQQAIEGKGDAEQAHVPADRIRERDGRRPEGPLDEVHPDQEDGVRGDDRVVQRLPVEPADDEPFDPRGDGKDAGRRDRRRRQEAEAEGPQATTRK